MATSRDITAKLAAKAAGLFTRRFPDEWHASVRYADGSRFDWGIKALSGQFVLEARHAGHADEPGGVVRHKKVFPDLLAAQKVAARFIERADGERLLAAAIRSGKFVPAYGSERSWA